MSDKQAKDPPFTKAVNHRMQLFDASFKDAVDSVQSTYANFKTRNERLTERQDDQSNSAQVQLISHFAVLATLTLTVIGFLFAQSPEVFSENEKKIILGILSLEILSLLFGALDYIQTIKFHKKWARIYQSIGKETDEKLNDSSLQETSQLNEIEAKHLDDAPEETSQFLSIAMIACAFAGLGLVLALFYVYFV